MSSIMQDKEREWATAFRNWSMENKDNKWYDSRFPNMGTEEHPLVGHNFDDWSFQVRNAIREALKETFEEGEEEDYEAHAEDFGEIIEDESYHIDDVEKATEFVIEQISSYLNDLEMMKGW